MGELKEWERVATDFLKHLLEVRGLAAQLRVLRDLRRLAEKRHALRDITEKIGEGLFELKTSHDRMEYRCIYTFNHPDIVVLVCFEKKTRKTPKHLIELAQGRRAQLMKTEIKVGNIVLH
jgi:phage-related protein